MLTKKFEVSGMCCSICLTKINGSLNKITSLNRFVVQMESPQVTVFYKDEFPTQEIINSINNAGHYVAKEIG